MCAGVRPHTRDDWEEARPALSRRAPGSWGLTRRRPQPQPPLRQILEPNVINVQSRLGGFFKSVTGLQNAQPQGSRVLNTGTHSHTHLYTHTYTRIHAHVRAHACMHAHAYMHARTETHARTYTRTHVHARARTYMHAHAHKDTCARADAQTRPPSSIWSLSASEGSQLWSQARCSSSRTPSTEHPAAGARGGGESVPWGRGESWDTGPATIATMGILTPGCPCL